jgi:hypothetical protein
MLNWENSNICTAKMKKYFHLNFCNICDLSEAFGLYINKLQKDCELKVLVLKKTF